MSLMSVLFVECFKTLIKNQNEQKVVRQKRRVQLLKTTLALLDWIHEFDPSNINEGDL
jgi:hypothetical protein